MAREAEVPADRSTLAALERLSVELDGRPEYLVEAAEQIRRRQGGASSCVPSGLDDLDVPRRLRDHVARTLRRLVDPHGAIIDAAAVVGCEFDIADVARAAGRSLEEVVTTVELAASAGLIREESTGRATFACQGVRAAVLDDLSPSRRGLIERRTVAPERLSLAPA